MRLLVLAALLAAAVGVTAQEPAPLAFEAVSIREPQGPVTDVAPSTPDRFVRRSTTLASLLLYAFEVSDLQLAGGPEWLRSRRFDIEAVAPRPATADETRAMVRRMLAERFALEVHRETRDADRYALVMARDDRRLGEKIRPSAIDCPAIVAARGPDYRPPPGPLQAGGPPRCGFAMRMGGGVQAFTTEGQPVSILLGVLQRDAGRIIVDHTGLSGTYDIQLEWELPFRPELAAFTRAQPGDGLSLFTALQEQLGLKLQPDRGPVEFLVIDRAELPTPN